jgi:hypothetical protein
MFGKGVYLTEVASKSGLHCHATAARPYGFLILARVALGKEFRVIRPDVALENCAYKSHGYECFHSFVVFLMIRVMFQMDVGFCHACTRYNSVRVLGRLCSDPDVTSILGNGAFFRTGMKF